MNPEEEKQKAVWRQQKHLEIKTELQQNEKLHQFLEKAYPSSRAEFIDEYAGAKVRWLEWGPNHIKWLEQEDLQWVNDAFERLKEIQQKKLFDAQCLWRAEKLTIKQVKLTTDFRYWEKDILNCPFITPVTEDEVEMYMQYLRSFNFEDKQGWFSSWQDYEGIKAAYNEESETRNFPDWYDFHNGRTGLSVYMLLPDIRGEKEEFYLDLWRAEMKRLNELEKKKKENEPQAPVAQQDNRPWLNYHKEGWLTWFVNTFEDKQTQEMFERFGGERAFRGSDEFLNNDLNTIGRAADSLIAVEAWYDWKEAIHKAADKYRREKIAEALPLAFEQYRMNIDLQIAFEKPENFIERMTDGYPGAILKGRELNGEPQDFNF